jgi:hypothetical protein
MIVKLTMTVLAVGADKSFRTGTADEGEVVPVEVNICPVAPLVSEFVTHATAGTLRFFHVLRAWRGPAALWRG